MPIHSEEDKTELFGIDISHHNGIIVWPQLVTNIPKVDFVYIKATQGTGFTDPMASFNANQAQQNKIPFGYYHFATLNTFDDITDARAEAIYFLNVIKSFPEPKLPLVLDIETNKVQLPQIKVLEWITVFFTELEKAGFKDSLLYSYSSFLENNLPFGHNIKNRLWLAGYVKPQKLKIPHGWNNYSIWQYSDSGKIAGIKTPTDLNKAPLEFL